MLLILFLDIIERLIGTRLLAPFSPVRLRRTMAARAHKLLTAAEPTMAASRGTDLVRGHSRIPIELISYNTAAICRHAPIFLL